MNPLQPYLPPRLLRATRFAGTLCLALVILHYLGLIGTPPPTLTRIGLYLAAGGVGGLAYAAADWLWRRSRGPTDLGRS